MRISVSNIAWDIVNDESIAKLLSLNAVDAIDVAPSKYFPDLTSVGKGQVLNIRSWWADRGVEIVGMQSLLYGTSGLNIFGSPSSRKEMLSHLDAVCRVANWLGAKNLVFGSPKNRDRSGLSDVEVEIISLAFFKELAKRASDREVTICLEPNPVCYGANFMTTVQETATVVDSVANEAIKMQLDTGALKLNNEDPAAVIAEFARMIGHIHISEPDLLPIGDGGVNHDFMALEIERYLPNHIVTIEMLATVKEPQLISVERALVNTIQSYKLNRSDE